jgi:hypothetical protein
VARASLHGLPKLSDVALLKRLRNSAEWLRWMCAAMLKEQTADRSWRWLPKGYRLRVVDSTTVEEPGATGTDWRVHYSLELPGLFCDDMEVSDAHGGESLCRFAVTEGDLLLGDRGYCRPPQLAHVLKGGADFIVRWHSSSLPLAIKGSDARARVFKWLRSLKGKRTAQMDVWTKGSEQQLRLCAVAVGEQALEREIARVKESARKSGRKASSDSLELCRFVVVVTSVSEEHLSASQVLQVYRLRWQIELAFKRFKSLLNSGHIPKYDPDSSRAWLQGKLLTSLLIERLLQESELFSPWGFPLPEQ